MSSEMFPDQGEIRRAIATVFDPCSVNAGVSINVIDMGLILGWSIGADRHVDILMRLTSPGCTLAPSFMHEIEAAVSAVAHVASAKVTISGHSLWSESNIAPASLCKLREARRKSSSLIGTRPQQWRTALTNANPRRPVLAGKASGPAVS
ncbi:metal-sulfur cluster assembly factor [Bradyrhizobium sp. TM239]|uniref:metal-sulfur cluster assembly factor n=1 Tax=Bradyrhizobium sp. TM239 TaxID=2599802 RepID=UPI0030C7175A